MPLADALSLFPDSTFPNPTNTRDLGRFVTSHPRTSTSTLPVDMSTPTHTQPSNRWDIDTALTRFVTHPRRFREALRDVDGLISGGFALQFLAGVEWPESDLDICVCKDRAQKLADYLVEVEGYDLCSRLVGKYNWSEVQAYDKPAADQKSRKLIEIICTRQEPIKSVLTECYTTALVNVITYNAAYSLFPIPTFINRVTFSLKEPNTFHNVLLRKYRVRGFKDIQRLPSAAENATYGGCFTSKTKRRVGDDLTWKTALPMSNILSSQVSSGIEDACFEIQESRLPDEELDWMVLKPVD